MAASTSRSFLTGRAAASATGKGAPAAIQRRINSRSPSDGLGPEGGMSFSTPSRFHSSDSSGLPGTT